MVLYLYYTRMKGEFDVRFILEGNDIFVGRFRLSRRFLIRCGSLEDVETGDRMLR